MDWREYEEGVARLYEQLGGVGSVERNCLLADKDTGHPRQIDVLLELHAKGHCLRVVIDAKFRKRPVDVKVVEETIGLVTAVGACKGMIVASNGWTKTAEVKSAATGLDLRLLTLEEALDLIVPDKW